MLRSPLIAALELASPWALAWLAAAALPWLINLWNRRRHVEAPWAAVDLLLKAIRERSRRLRLRELLLLALRTTIIALAALAAARPWWRSGADAAESRARTHHVFVIDQSFSMATEANGATRLDRAQARVRERIEASPAGDAYTVIVWGQTADNLAGKPTFDASQALAALESIGLTDGVAELPTAVRTAAAAVEAAGREFPALRQSEVVFASDMTQVAWEAGVTRSGAPPDASAAERDAAGDWQRLAQRASLVIDDADDGVRANAAIIALEIDPPRPTLDQELSVIARIQNFGAKAQSSLNVELLLDGAPVGKQVVQASSEEPVAARFATRLLQSGSHVFEARLQDGIDALPIDNRRWLAVDARPAPRVLCVYDAAGAARDVARALDPQLTTAAGGTSLRVELAPAARLGATELAGYEAVFVCNVAELSMREQRLLSHYVAAGGAAAIVLGGRSRVDAYNEFFQAQGRDESAGGEQFLPVQLAAATDGEWRLDPLEYRHPILAPFVGRTRAGLLGVRVARYIPVRVAGDSARVQTALAFSSGDPAIVISEYGLGRAAVVATDPALATTGEPWSSWAISPSFLPLMRELTTYLAANRRTERLNAVVGQSLAPPRDFLSGAPSAVWKTPAGDVAIANAADAGPLELRHRGVYTLLKPGGQVRSAAESGSKFEAAANVDPRESDLATVDPQDRASMTAHAVVSPLPGARYAAIPLDRSLLAAAAALLMLELLVAWLLGRG